MQRIILLIATLLAPCLVFARMLPLNSHPATSQLIAKEAKHSAGTLVYIQIFKEEGILELYTLMGEQYRLLKSYPICKFSGGLGPKRLPGDLKSPEGFYAIDLQKLNPNSRFHRSMDIGFPNAYDQAHGYHGNYLMIHGACSSVGCYAMTDDGISEIYHYVENALRQGQKQVQVSVYPFRMTDDNMQRHKYSNNLEFWKQLKPVYDYFTTTHQPAPVFVNNGRYIIASTPVSKTSLAKLTSNQPFTEMK